MLRQFYTISYLSDYHATLFVGLYQSLKVVVFGSLKYKIFFFVNCIACFATYERQGEANPAVIWLAIQKGKAGLSSPLGINCFVSQENIFCSSII